MHSKNKKRFKIDWKEIFSVLGLFTAWRIIIWLIAFISKGRLSLLKDQAIGESDQSWIENIPSFLRYWARWDSGWYLNIAEKGYFWNSPKDWSNVVFFPLYPQLIRLIAYFIDNKYFIAGIIASSLAALLACFYLYRLVKLELGKKSALRSVLYLLIFPTSIFLASIYSESLFILTAIASIYHARRNQWYAASIWGLLTALTRPAGIIILGVLLLEYFEQRKFNPLRVKADVLNLLLVPCGLGTYMYFLHQRFRNPFLFAFAQDAWNREANISLINLWQTTVNHFQELIKFDISNMAHYLSSAFDFIFFIIFFILSIVVFFFVRKSYGTYMLLYLIIPALTGTFTSMGRFALALFPAFILLAKWGKNQAVNYSITILFSMLSALFIAMFVNTYWIG
jgi:Gpi18-like mannosyltransferase